MARRLGKFVFLLVVIGNLSLNHFLLGYCDCAETVFLTHCPCEEERCPCGECPLEEPEKDCSTYFSLELDDFAQSIEVKLPSIQELPMVAASLISDLQSPRGWFPKDKFEHPLCQAKSLPGSLVPLRLLYSALLV